MPDWKDCWLLFSFAGMTYAWGAELPVGMVSERWRAPTEITTVSPRLTQTSTASGAMVEWADEVASFGSGLAVVNGRGNDRRPWLVVGARAMRLEGLRLGGVLGLRHDAEAWSVDFKVAGGLGDSFFGDDLTVVQDVNGDGFDELLVFWALPLVGTAFLQGWALHHGAPEGWETEPAWVLGCHLPAPFGFGHMASAGDINRDGFGDVAIGLPDAVEGAGIALIFHGSAAGLAREPAWVKTGEQPGELFGFGVSGIGDVDGDGYDDLLVGAPGYESEGKRLGRVQVFPGSKDGLGLEAAWSMAGESPTSWFGADAAPAGDVNGDGFADFLVSAPGPSTKFARALDWPGRVYCFAGGPEGPDAVPRSMVEGRSHADWFGRSFAVLGDMDGDGEVELAVGLPRSGETLTTQGEVNVFTLRRDFAVVPRIKINGSTARQRFGWRVAGADFNQDGFADLAATGPFHRPASANSGHGMVAVVWGGRGVFARHPELAVAETLVESTAPPARKVKPWLAWSGATVSLLLTLGVMSWWGQRREREVVQRERQRISRDLHDQLGAHLTGLALRSGTLRRTLDGQEQRVAGELSTIEAAAGQLVDNLAEIVWLTQPTNDSLEQLVHYLLDYAGKALEPADITCRFDVPAQLPDVVLGYELRHDLLLSVKEALHNVVKHAQARQVTLSMRLFDGRVEFAIQDNGGGFSSGANASGGNGLRNLRERMRRHGGQLDIDSGLRGTRVRLSIPLSRPPTL